MLAKVYAAAILGLKARLVTVEVDIANRGLPAFTIVGLPDKAIAEARERVRAALVNSGCKFPRFRITVNLAPADLPKEGAGYDLAIAVGIMASAGEIPAVDLSDKMFLGELALDGGLRPVPGALLVAQLAARQQIPALFLSAASLTEISLIDSVAAFCPATLGDLLRHLRHGGQFLSPVVNQALKRRRGGERDKSDKDRVDLADVAGQERAKRALEIAAAGGHNLRMVGPPGSGKTLLAKGFASILPPLRKEEMVELTGIYSAMNMLPRERSVIDRPPFRAPHHTCSYVGMIGGGTNPRPGEATLAHRGVLFLDEFSEFPRAVLEALRQPLEQGEVWVTRAAGNARFPANFTLIAAHNPCPCGFRGAKMPGKACRCRSAELDRYYRRLSGPILDRIDLHVWVDSLRPEQLAQAGEGRESSEKVSRRVRRARKRQSDRYRDLDYQTNCDLPLSDINDYCRLEAPARRLLNRAMVVSGLSNRAYHRVMKVARTIADLQGLETIQPAHVAEALSFRWEIANAGLQTPGVV